MFSKSQPFPKQMPCWARAENYLTIFMASGKIGAGTLPAECDIMAVLGSPWGSQLTVSRLGAIQHSSKVYCVLWGQPSSKGKYPGGVSSKKAAKGQVTEMGYLSVPWPKGTFIWVSELWQHCFIVYTKVASLLCGLASPDWPPVWGEPSVPAHSKDPLGNLVPGQECGITSTNKDRTRQVEQSLYSLWRCFATLGCVQFRAH